MKYRLLAFIVLVLAACSNQESEQSIKDQIAAHRKEVGALNLKIAELEKKLKTVDPMDGNSDKVAVEVQSLTYEPFKHYIQVSGTAEAVHEAYISPEVPGQLREIYVKEGDHVKQGQLLARLNSEITESNIADLKTSLALATTVYEKQARLWEKGIGSEIQYLDAKNNKESLTQKLVTLQAQLDMTLVKSPVNGIVDEIYHKNGEMTMPGVQLMRIVNLQEIYINADVAETYLGEVNEGKKVQVNFPVYPDLSMEVPIYRKGNTINPSNRTFTIQLKVSNPDNLLKPNILAVIDINDYSSDSALVVPSILIKQDITGSYLYTTKMDEGKLIAKKVYVTTGQSYKDKTMVVSGLQPGEQVIVEGYSMVSDGSEVYVKSGNAT